MIYDDLIIKLFFNEDNTLNKNYRLFINRIKKHKYCNIENYLLNRFDDLTINSKTILKESLYRILRHIEYRVKCPICGKYTTFNPLKENCYNNHCSRSCEMKNPEVMKKHNDTCLEKYGSVNNSEKLKKTKLERYGDEKYNNSKKRHNTNLKKYGYICPLQNSDIKEKTINTNILKYGDKIPQKNELVKNKIKKSNIKTCRFKYGIDNIMQLDSVYEKYQDTMIKTYGTDNFSKSKFYQENYVSILGKSIETKRKNNSFNTSNPEEESYLLLKEKYQDIIRQYKSEKYPFLVDFYIPSLDLYIECNYHWTHGKHAFDCNNSDDIKTLEKWKQKNTKFYKNAIDTWSIRDVKKRNSAKQNKLNYIEFWDINEIKKWLNTDEL